MWRKTISVLTVCVTVVGCAILTSKVDDLRVDAIDFVTLDSQDDAPVLSQFLRQGNVVLKVKLSSQIDLGRLAEKGDLNVAVDAGGCPLRNDNELSKWPYVYLKGVEVGYIGVSKFQRDQYKILASRVPPSQRFEYDVYIQSMRERTVRVGAPSYDLLSKPFDICLRLSGGNMAGGSLTSNTVQIGRDAIIKAAERRPAVPSKPSAVPSKPSTH